MEASGKYSTRCLSHTYMRPHCSAACIHTVVMVKNLEVRRSDEFCTSAEQESECQGTIVLGQKQQIFNNTGMMISTTEEKGRTLVCACDVSSHDWCKY